MPSITTDDIPCSFDKIEHLYDFSLSVCYWENHKENKKERLGLGMIVCLYDVFKRNKNGKDKLSPNARFSTFPTKRVTIEPSTLTTKEPNGYLSQFKEINK